MKCLRNTWTTLSLSSWHSQRFTKLFFQASTHTTASLSLGQQIGKHESSTVSLFLTWLCNTLPFQTLCVQVRTTSTHWLFWWLQCGFGFTVLWLCGSHMRSRLASTFTSVFCLWSCIPLESCCVIWRKWMICVQQSRHSRSNILIKGLDLRRPLQVLCSRSQGWWDCHGWCIFRIIKTSNLSTRASSTKCHWCWLWSSLNTFRSCWENTKLARNSSTAMWPTMQFICWLLFWLTTESNSSADDYLVNNLH